MNKILSIIVGINFVLTSGCALLEPSEDFDPESLPSTAAGATEVSSQVISSKDDAEERPNGKIRLSNSDLELVQDGNENQIIGLRFKLNVPQGVQINDASILFTVDEVTTTKTSLKIYAQAADNADAFAGNTNNIKNRKKTVSSVDWVPPAWKNKNESGSAQRTVSLAKLTQEVVDRAGWKSGNYIVFIITGIGTRTAESFDGSAPGAPKLLVSYSTKTLEPTPPPPDESVPVFGYQGLAYDPLVKPVYDLAYRDGFTSPDSDKDGLPDSWESAYGLDPNDASDAKDSSIDPDQDLLTGYEEFMAGTNPKDSDSDGDGMPDGYEVIYSLNPLDSSDALADADGDGYNNLDEYLNGTDPNNPLVFPIIKPTTYTIEIAWVAPAERTDGSVLSSDEIASFTIYYGTSENSLDTSVVVSDPTLRSYSLILDTAGLYFFAVTATDRNNSESEPSPIGSITVSQ